jgi:chemotaxis protein CheD
MRQNGVPEGEMSAMRRAAGLGHFAKAANPLIHRYTEASGGRSTVKIAPGGIYVSNQDEAIVTVLGSCISACIHDPLAGVGGMNHFMLPSNLGAQSRPELLSDAHRYGCFAMEMLINEILKLGGRREMLGVKLFGGAHSLAIGSRVGDMNIHFARQYIRKEGLKLLGEDLGGSAARRLKYLPQTGQAFLWRPGPGQLATLAAGEQTYRQTLDTRSVGEEVELF